MNYEKHLEEIGFKPVEATLYLFLLNNGASSQQEISDKAQILRQTVYELVTKMENKGFISSSLVNKRKIYTAIDPQILLTKLREKEEKFQRVVKDLEKMRTIDKQPLFSETFIGVQGLKNLFTTTLQSKSDLLWLANEATHNALFKDYYWKNYALKRKEQHIPIKLIVNANVKKHTWTSDKHSLREVRSAPFANNLYSSFVAYDDKIILYSITKEELQGVYIQNKELKRLFTSIFMNLWKEGKKV